MQKDYTVIEEQDEWTRNAFQLIAKTLRLLQVRIVS